MDIETQLHKLINRPKNIYFLADEEIGLVTIRYDYKGDRHEIHEKLDHFKIYMRCLHRDYIKHYNLCTRGEPLYNWTEILHVVPQECPEIIYQFLKLIKEF
jgi:hypothetical protein